MVTPLWESVPNHTAYRKFKELIIFLGYYTFRSISSDVLNYFIAIISYVIAALDESECQVMVRI